MFSVAFLRKTYHNILGKQSLKTHKYDIMHVEMLLFLLFSFFPFFFSCKRKLNNVFYFF